MKLHRGLIRLLLLTSLAGALSAADVEGVLMDKMCSMKAVKEGQKAAAMQHTRQCAMMPDCEKSDTVPSRRTTSNSSSTPPEMSRLPPR
jgi:hypothetical protein